MHTTHMKRLLVTSVNRIIIIPDPKCKSLSYLNDCIAGTIQLYLIMYILVMTIDLQFSFLLVQLIIQ